MEQKPDKVILNTIAITMDPLVPRAQAVALLQDRILAVGSDEDEQIFAAGTDPTILSADDGSTVQVLSAGGDSILVRLDGTLNIVPDADRVYNRITLEGEQVPVTQEGLPLTGAAYGTLNADEKGDDRDDHQQFHQ